MNKNIQGHLFALTANILWGLMALVGKSALVEFSALSVTTFSHGRCSSLFLVALTVLQTRAGRPSGYVEDILCRTLRTGIQSGSLYLRTVHDFPIDASIVTTTLPI